MVFFGDMTQCVTFFHLIYYGLFFTFRLFLMFFGLFFDRLFWLFLDGRCFNNGLLIELNLNGNKLFRGFVGQY